MVTSVSGLTAPLLWQRVSTGDATVAVAERAALGTSARVAVWPPESLDGALAAVDGVLGALDRQASRFREDSDQCRLAFSFHEVGVGVRASRSARCLMVRSILRSITHEPGSITG